MRPLLATLLTALVLAGCFGGDAPPTTSTPTATPTGGGEGAAFALASPAFENGGDIPRAHTCDGADASPPLNLTGAPAETASFALIMLDPDVPVPEAPTQTLVHWLVWNVNVTDGGAVFAEGQTPPGAVEGEGVGGTGYAGPCPPHGSSAHGYEFTAYALDGMLDLPAGATRAQLEEAMEGRVLTEASLTGMYARALPVS